MILKATNFNFPDSLDIRPSENSCTNQEFSAEAQRVAIARYGIAGRVWEAAYLLLTYIQSKTLQFDPPIFPPRFDCSAPRTIIELGAGVGLVSAVLSEIVDQRDDLVIATDLPEVCTLLESNLNRHRLSGRPIEVWPLAWGNQNHAQVLHSKVLARRPLTHVICSDLVYFPELLAPLLRTLICITAHPYTAAPAAEIILSYKLRSLTKESPFWSAFGLWFDYRPVLIQENDQWSVFQGMSNVIEKEETFIFVGRRRSESLAWDVPTTDTDLLDGVGAGGTTSRKGDDTFESILFMSMDIGG